MKKVGYAASYRHTNGKWSIPSIDEVALDRSHVEDVVIPRIKKSMKKPVRLVEVKLSTKVIIR